MNEVRATVTHWWRKEQSVIEWCLCQALRTELSSRLPLRSVRLSYIMLQQISPNLSLRPTHTTHPTQMGRMFCSHSHPGIQANRGIKISEPVAKCGGPQRHLPIPLTMRCTDPATRPQPTTKGPRSCLPVPRKRKNKSPAGTQVKERKLCFILLYRSASSGPDSMGLVYNYGRCR